MEHRQHKGRLGIIGYGIFGRFMAAHLAPHFEVLVWSRTRRETDPGVRWAGLAEAAACPVVILAVSVQSLEEMLRKAAPHLQPGTLVFDVASVKTVPVQLMQELVPAGCDIIATHPVFGPQSGAKGIAGLTVVTWPVRVKHERYEAVQRFLGHTLGLKVLEVSPEEHDRQMAYVQALTFFIGRALGEMELPAPELTVPKYEYLREIRKLVAGDTAELFELVQRYNPYAEAVRERFVSELERIEHDLEGSESRSKLASPE
jgi:prephenate dehydrogenase